MPRRKPAVFPAIVLKTRRAALVSDLLFELPVLADELTFTLQSMDSVVSEPTASVAAILDPHSHLTPAYLNLSARAKLILSPI